MITCWYAGFCMQEAVKALMYSSCFSNSQPEMSDKCWKGNIALSFRLGAHLYNSESGCNWLQWRLVSVDAKKKNKKCIVPSLIKGSECYCMCYQYHIRLRYMRYGDQSKSYSWVYYDEISFSYTWMTILYEQYHDIKFLFTPLMECSNNFRSFSFDIFIAWYCISCTIWLPIKVGHLSERINFL